jgi:uncharacterized protein (DUF1697 family)
MEFSSETHVNEKLTRIPRTVKWPVPLQKRSHGLILLTDASPAPENYRGFMAQVVFLKGVNVGGHRRFRPTLLARNLANLGVVNVGAAGTFVVWKPISRARLRREFLRRIPFQTEAMVCSGKDILQLASGEHFAGQPSGPDIVHFVSIMASSARVPPALPLDLPAREDWLVKIVALRGQFALGLYRRTMRTIAAFNQLEKHLGGCVTTRNWKTVSNLCEILSRKNAKENYRRKNL